MSSLNLFLYHIFFCYLCIMKNQAFIYLKIWLLSVFVSVVFISSAQNRQVTRSTIDSLWQKLSEATNPADSVKILFNLYDASVSSDWGTTQRIEAIDVLNRLFETSLRAKDTVSAYDAVRYLSTVSRYNVPFVDEQLRRIESMPPSTDRSETQTYLNLQRYFWALRDTTLTEDQRRQNFHAIREKIGHNESEKSLYDRLDQQFALVMYGSNLVEPEQMDKYLEDLNNLVELVHDRRKQIIGYYYRIAAMLYDENENGSMSNLIDRKMLDVLDELDKKNIEQGRVFRNYDEQRFLVYRRMLGNYEHMSADSVRMVHDQLNKIMHRMPKNAISKMDRLSVSAMWNMFNDNYSAALPMLRELMTSKRFQNKPNYIRAYIQAALATHNIEDVHKGQELYSELIINRARDAADTEYAKLKIEYEVDSLNANILYEKERADEANRRRADMANNYLTYILIGLGVLLLSIIIIQILSKRKVQRMATRLQEANQNLMKERNALNTAKQDLEKANSKAMAAMRQRTEYIHNVSNEISEPVKNIVGFTELIVDSVPEERRKYLQKFIDIIAGNSEILQRIVGDIQDIAEVDDNKASVTVTHFLPEEVCKVVAESMSLRMTPQQTLTVEPMRIVGSAPGGDEGIDSDATRLEQILTAVVGNAVKFCEIGSITISPEIDYEKGWLTIAVSDTGPGIPEGKEEIIFERFERFGNYTSGLGLGLYVARQFSKLLEGTIFVDKEYKKGARFVLTIPISIRPN